MARKSTECIALISIHPQYAFAILGGEKTVEFRKRVFRRPVQYVLLYATAPVSRLVGFFKIAKIDEASPTAIWDRHGRHGAISRGCFREYYSGTRTAVAIIVETPTAFDRPMPLTEVLPSGYTPQSFAYVDSDKYPVVEQMVAAKLALSEPSPSKLRAGPAVRRTGAIPRGGAPH